MLQSDGDHTLSMEKRTKFSRTVGVILAGGRSRRMGASKPEQVLAGRSLLEHVVRRAEHQVDELILSSNSSSTFYQQFGFPIVPDRDDSQAGPLMGIASVMDWIVDQQTRNAALPLIACFPVDVPIFPDTIVVQLKRALLAQNKQVAVALEANQLQPLFSLWNCSSAEIINQALRAGIRGPKPMLSELDAVAVKITCSSEFDFTNLNTQQDMLALAGKLGEAESWGAKLESQNGIIDHDSR